MISRHYLFVTLFGLTLTAGCSPYVEDFHYLPQPAIADIRTAPAGATQPSAQPAPVTAYASIVGIRRENRDQHVPLSVEVRIRLDNHGPQVVNFDPRSLDLTTADLLPFQPPLVQPPGQITLATGQTLIVVANFPFPPGRSINNTNLQSLQLHWSVMIDGNAVPQAADFHRAQRYYYDPYWEPGPYPYGYPYGYGYPYPYWYPYVGIGGAVIIRR